MCAQRTVRPPSGRSSSRDQVSALANGLRAIEAFSSAHHRMSLTDVAKRAGLTRAAARRYLLTLTSAGYADFDGKLFRLTPRVLRLGHAYLSSVRLPQIAQPIVEELGEKSDEAAALAVLDGTRALIIAASAPRRIVGIFTRVGTHLPAISSSTGRILLADKGEEALENHVALASPIQKLTPKTKTSATEILAEIRLVRQTGYALNDEEIEVGLRVISVPVRNATGTVVAALCISAYSGRFEIDQLQRSFLPALKKSSDRLARLL